MLLKYVRMCLTKVQRKEEREGKYDGKEEREKREADERERADATRSRGLHVNSSFLGRAQNSSLDDFSVTYRDFRSVIFPSIFCCLFCFFIESDCLQAQYAYERQTMDIIDLLAEALRLVNNYNRMGWVAFLPRVAEQYVSSFDSAYEGSSTEHAKKSGSTSKINCMRVLFHDCAFSRIPHIQLSNNEKLLW